MIEITAAIKMLCILVVCFSFCLGFWTAKIFFDRMVKIIFEELRGQYLKLLEKHGIDLSGK
jgi:hypothetical protein